MERQQFIQRVLWRSALVSGLIVAFGALSHETERIWREPGRIITRSEGAQHWAGLAMLCGLLAVATIWQSRIVEAWRVNMLQASAALFLIAAVSSGTHWLRLIEERSTATGYDVEIALGLPVTVTASILGGALSLALLMSARFEEVTLSRRTEPSSAKQTTN